MSIFNVSSNAGKIIDTIVDSQDLSSKDLGPIAKWAMGTSTATAVPNSKALPIGVYSVIVSGQIIATIANPA